MTNATKTRAIECQQWAAHWSKQASICREFATANLDCPHRLKAMDYQRLAQINASTARAILAD